MGAQLSFLPQSKRARAAAQLAKAVEPFHLRMVEAQMIAAHHVEHAQELKLAAAALAPADTGNPMVHRELANDARSMLSEARRLTRLAKNTNRAARVYRQS